MVKISFYGSVLKESAAITKVMILFSGVWGKAPTSILRSGSTGALLAKEYLIFKVQRCKKASPNRRNTKPILQSAVIREVMYDALENMVGI